MIHKCYMVFDCEFFGVFTFVMLSRVKSSLCCIALPRNVSVGVTFCTSAQTLQGVAWSQRYSFRSLKHRLLTKEEVRLKTIAHVSLASRGVAASLAGQRAGHCPLCGDSRTVGPVSRSGHKLHLSTCCFHPRTGQATHLASYHCQPVPLLPLQSFELSQHKISSFLSL